MSIDAAQIIKLLAALADRRCAFCSEMDFQLHLAWEMKREGWELALEYDPQCFDANAAIDILVLKPQRVAVELKYKTASLELDIGGRSLKLKNQAAQDVARHDFMKDISRVEQVVASGQAERGYAIFLTNDGGYWREGKDGTADAMFRMSEGRSVANGTFKWGAQTSPGTMRGRETPILLTRDYVFGWRDYSDLGKKSGVFRYLMVEVDAVSAGVKGSSS